MNLEIPPPKFVELSEDWLPWRYQVLVFGDPAKYGSTSQSPIIRGTSNFENLTDAKIALNKAMANHFTKQLGATR